MKMERSLNKNREAAQSLDPIIRIGKRGITPALIEEIKKQVKRRKVIKVKMLKSAIEGIDRKQFAERIAKESGSELVGVIGGSAVLARHEEGKKKNIKGLTPEK